MDWVSMQDEANQPTPRIKAEFPYLKHVHKRLIFCVISIISMVALVVHALLIFVLIIPSIPVIDAQIGSWIRFENDNWLTHCSIWNCDGLKKTTFRTYEAGEYYYAYIDTNYGDYYEMLSPDAGLSGGICNNCTSPYQVIQSLFALRSIIFFIWAVNIIIIIATVIILLWSLIPLFVSKEILRKYPGTVLLQTSIFTQLQMFYSVVAMFPWIYFILYRPFARSDGSLDSSKAWFWLAVGVLFKWYSIGMSFYYSFIVSVVPFVFNFAIPIISFFVLNLNAMWGFILSDYTRWKDEYEEVETSEEKDEKETKDE